MSEGRLERAIRETLAAHPDETFPTDELAERCYPDARRIERKHRVAVLRAVAKGGPEGGSIAVVRAARQRARQPTDPLQHRLGAEHRNGAPSAAVCRRIAAMAG